RLHPGGGQRDRGRAAPVRRLRCPDALHTRARVACDQGGPEMIPAAFEYTRASTVDEAVAALADAGEDAKILAGGQSLIPPLRLRLAGPTTLVDLGGVADLRGVREEGDALVIGATTTHAAVLADPLVARYAPLLAQATATVADRQVRHRGTIGGSLAHADPAG